MNNTPRGERLHIAIFGRRNAGKSSLINSVTKQNLSLVSDVPGTTTDPVYKSMEILPVGPVVLIDTAGVDDEGELGALRVERTLGVLSKTDLAVLVLDPFQGIGPHEAGLLEYIHTKTIPVIGVINKADAFQGDLAALHAEWSKQLGIPLAIVSASTRQGIDELVRLISANAPGDWVEPSLVGDLISPGDTAVLVVPIDMAAPKGRLILPQVETIRDLLDHDAAALVVKERELKDTLQGLARKPRIVITDSQAFLKVDADTPPDVLLTSFSILMARHKGDLAALVAGAKAIDSLKPGDRVLIAEGCTHQCQPDDIGRVKIPRWLRQYVGGDLQFEFYHGNSYPDDLADFKLIVHCGSCMLNRREMLWRIGKAREEGVPIVNYGVAIAHLHGILKRALSPFPLAQMIMEGEAGQ
ncbi:MAG: [FeFe] hydrogenase H-cluster maturation GTPase HydF [Mycobacterium leprae]